MKWYRLSNELPDVGQLILLRYLRSPSSDRSLVICRRSILSDSIRFTTVSAIGVVKFTVSKLDYYAWSLITLEEVMIDHPTEESALDSLNAIS